MKAILTFLIAIFLYAGCQTISSNAVNVSNTEINANSKMDVETALIRKIDFQNFTFPWTKTFGDKEKTFSLKNGMAKLADERNLVLKSVAYINVVDDFDEQALVNIDIDDGNASYQMLYVFAVENGKPKLLESFEFGENTVSFGTAFDAHGELIIETYLKKPADAECCPSIIEISYYKWQKDKFVLQGESQIIPNGYVERQKSVKSK